MSREKGMGKTKVIGITGGIGSGKTYISQLLSGQRGIPVYECDERAKQLTAHDPSARAQLAQIVGRSVLTPDGICKPLLAQYLFSSQAHAAQVEAIIHPLVRKDFLLWISRQATQLAGIESAILFQSGFHELTDFVLLVDAPLETRIARAMQRDHAHREQVEQRISRQDVIPRGFHADFRICNDEGTSQEDLLTELDKIISETIQQEK